MMQSIFLSHKMGKHCLFVDIHLMVTRINRSRGDVGKLNHKTIEVRPERIIDISQIKTSEIHKAEIFGSFLLLC